MAFGRKTKEKINELTVINQELQQKTAHLSSENEKINSSLTSLYASYQYFTGETTQGELSTPKEIIIIYEALRVRSWEFILKNHLASLIVQKRVNWTIGKGLLFNSKPADKPFLDFYKDEKLAKEMQKKFINDSEYMFRTYAKTTLPDYSGKKNLHELARHTDYNACGDGDELLIMRVKNAFPNIQGVSGQVVVNPALNEEIPENNSILEGVEYNSKGEIVAYHVLKNTEIANGIISKKTINIDFGTKRVMAFFPGTKILSAWLYMQSDLQKQGETRAMPLLSHVFETLKHLNDYLIANAKNAQLLAQLVLAFEKNQNSDGEKTFGANAVNLPGGMSEATTEACATDAEVVISANKAEFKLNGNGIVLDLPKGVQAKALNPQAQSDQADYLKSTLQTLSATIGIPYEVLISSYNSNYTASMGARSDFQFNLDVLTEAVPANQFYRKVWDMFIFLQIMSGGIVCPPLLKAYNENDTITIQAIINSTFEGTKLKPIDPLKFIKSLREQLPANIRDQIPLNTIENLVNASSGGDYGSVLTQVENEADLIPEILKPKEPETNINQE